MGNTVGGGIYYGFVNANGNQNYKGKLVRVDSGSTECNRDCESLGLSSRHACCWDTFEEFDTGLRALGHYASGGNLGPGIVNFTVFNLPYHLANWMASVKDEILISNVRLPASHDAGSAQSDKLVEIFSFARTQSFSILNQLIMGIRAFDIRPTRAGQGAGMEDGGIWTHHGRVKGERLSRATFCAKMFLRAYPSEVVIFYISHQLNCSLHDAYDVIRDEMGYCHFVDSSETVGSLRGKLVILKEEKLHMNVPYNDHKGRDSWDELLPWLNRIPRRNGEFNRFPTALTPRRHTPNHLAISGGLEGLERWLNSPNSNNIGIVEADWFGNCHYITRLVELIVNKNKM